MSIDYSLFVEAILNNDEPAITDQVNVITPVLIKFLRVRLDASLSDAQDCAQNTLLIAVEKIRNDKIQHPEVIINYLFTTAKHEYLKVATKQRELQYEEPPDSHSARADQLQNLLDKEKLSLLRRCIEALKPDYKQFINYWFQHPAFETEVVADHFEMSVNNAWTKKHRIINKLRDCVEKKF